MNVPDEKRPSSREDHVFPGEGASCVGWLYRPKGVQRPSVLLMAHGFAGERRAALPASTERFAERGRAVFVFDDRGFADG